MEYVELNQRAKVMQVRISSSNHQEAVSFRGDAKAEPGHVPSHPARKPEEVAGLGLPPDSAARPVYLGKHLLPNCKGEAAGWRDRDL